MQLGDENRFPTKSINLYVTEIASERVNDGCVTGSVGNQNVCNTSLKRSIGDNVAARYKTKCSVILPGLSIVKTTVSRPESKLMAKTIDDTITAAATGPDQERWRSRSDHDFTATATSGEDGGHGDGNDCRE